MRMRSSCDRRERTSFMCSNQTDTLDLVPTQLTGTKLDLLETRNSKHTNNRGSCLTATIATSNCSKSPSNSARASQSWALLMQVLLPQTVGGAAHPEQCGGRTRK